MPTGSTTPFGLLLWQSFFGSLGSIRPLWRGSARCRWLPWRWFLRHDSPKRKARTYHRSDEYGLRLHREIPLGGRLVVNLQSSWLFPTVKSYPCTVVVALLNSNGNSWPTRRADIPKRHMHKGYTCQANLRSTLAAVATWLLYDDVNAGLGTSAWGSGRHRILALHSLQ